MKEIKIDPACAVSFSGHRPERLPGHGNPGKQETQDCIAALQELIEGAINRGKYIFIHGAMAGWDIFAAEQVIILKEKHPGIILVTVAPYRAQFFSREKCWSPEWIERARKVFALHDMGEVVSEQYYRGIYYERNEVLINNSSELICFWDGGRGGTDYTVRYAQKKGVAVRNVYK